MTKLQIQRWLRKWENRGAAAHFSRELGISKAMFSMWLCGKRNCNRVDLSAEVPKLIAAWRTK